MKADRIHNFNAGPAALPLPVLEEIQESFLNFAGSGMSVTEISHRSKWFDDVINDAVARVKRILNLDSRFSVLFLQGGASMQFCMVPMNLLGAGDSADYVNTGTWSTKAIKEATILGKSTNVVASSEDRNFSYIPRSIDPIFLQIVTHLSTRIINYIMIAVQHACGRRLKAVKREPQLDNRVAPSPGSIDKPVESTIKVDNFDRKEIFP